MRVEVEEASALVTAVTTTAERSTLGRLAHVAAWSMVATVSSGALGRHLMGRPIALRSMHRLWCHLLWPASRWWMLKSARVRCSF